MKPSTLLAIGTLTLAASDLMAYQIVESRFHVEVAPNKYVDQLVLRCEDGHQVTVPWQSKLAEACGEDLMGNVTVPPAKASSAPVDEQQKQAMLEQLRSQYGNISEKQVEFISGPGGVSTRFKPPIVEVLKKYESCRKALKDKSYCAAERDKALARLADPKPASAAAPATESTESVSREPDPVAPVAEAAAHSESPVAEVSKPAASQAAAPTPEAPTRSAPPTAAKRKAKGKSAVAAPEAATAPAPAAATQQAASPSLAPGPAPTEATAQPAANAQAVEAQPAPPSEAELRSSAEQKINQDYMACMRAKPKFDCDQARTKSMAALDKPKVVKQRKPTSPATGPQAQR